MATFEEQFIKGHPTPILQTIQKNRSVDYSFNSHELQKILLMESVVHKKVVVVSISGVLRTGKSFMLNYFLRYLKADEESIQNDSWIGCEDEELKGFSWRGGDERDTTGILMWSKPFIKKLPNGEEVAVVLMDTQGAFDTKSGTNDCATIFALSTILSSVQIFNVMGMLDESLMQYLRVFSEYGKLISDKNDESEKFQHLLFLVRDWKHPQTYPYGKQGGSDYINKIVFDTSDKNTEVVENRDNLKNCFQVISGYLLPHPCLEANEDEHFKGEVKFLRDIFKSHFMDFIKLLFAGNNLKPKMIRGREMTCYELYHQFSNQYENFRTSKMPTVKAIQLGIDHAELLFHVSNCLEQYRRSMRELCDNFQVSEDDCRQHHAVSLDHSKNMFEEIIEKWSDHGLEQYRTKIVNECESLFAEYLNQCNLWIEKRNMHVTLMLTNVVSTATQTYKSLMENLVAGEMENDDLLKTHVESKEKSLAYFTEHIVDTKCNNNEISTFTKQLNEDCDREFVGFQNKWKNQRKTFGKHQLEEAIATGIDIYRPLMKTLQEKKELISFPKLKEYHDEFKNKSIQKYNDLATWQDKIDIDQYKTKLTIKLEKMFKDVEANLVGYHQRKCCEVKTGCVQKYQQLISKDFENTLSASALSEIHSRHLSTVLTICTSETNYFLSNDKLESLKQSISKLCNECYRQHEDIRKDWELEETRKRAEGKMIEMQKQFEQERLQNEKEREARKSQAAKQQQELMEKLHEQQMEALKERNKHELDLMKEKHNTEIRQKEYEKEIEMREKEHEIINAQRARDEQENLQKQMELAESERIEAIQRAEEMKQQEEEDSCVVL